MIKLAFKIIAFIGITYTLMTIFNMACQKRINQMVIGKTSHVINIANTKFDYVAGGSSRVESNFNTVLFDSITGTEGINIGADGSALSEVYLTLYLFLKNGNTTKNYLLQAEDNFLMNPKKAFSYPFHDFYFLGRMGESEVDNVFRNTEPTLKYYLWKYIPFIKYAEFNNYYGLSQMKSMPKVDPGIIESKGYTKLGAERSGKFPNKVYPDIHEEEPVYKLNIYYLNKIRELCLKNNINFLIYSSPLYQPCYTAYKPKNLHNALINFITENRITYYNFMTDPHYRGDSLFYDETHLNAVGTDIFTKQLADSLRDILKK